jgi:hypothetical protein
MKFIILLSTLFALSSHAAITNVQDDIILESNAALNCPPVTATKPTFPESTEVVLPADPALVSAVSEEVKELSPTEKLKVYRKKLEEKNLVLLEKKLELIRLQQEMSLLKNLEDSMNKTINAIGTL